MFKSVIVYAFLATAASISKPVAASSSPLSKLIRLKASNDVEKRMLRATAERSDEFGRLIADEERAIMGALVEIDQQEQDDSMSMSMSMSVGVSSIASTKMPTSTFASSGAFSETPPRAETDANMDVDADIHMPMSMDMCMSMGTTTPKISSMDEHDDDEHYGHDDDHHDDDDDGGDDEVEPVPCDEAEAAALKITIIVEVFQAIFGIPEDQFSTFLAEALARIFDTCIRADDEENGFDDSQFAVQPTIEGAKSGRSLKLNDDMAQTATLNVNNVKAAIDPSQSTCTPHFPDAKSCGAVTVNVPVYGNEVALESVFTAMGRIFAADDVFAKQCSGVGIAGVRAVGAEVVDTKSDEETETETKTNADLADKDESGKDQNEDGNQDDVDSKESSDEHDDASDDQSNHTKSKGKDSNMDIVRLVVFISLALLAVVTAMCCCQKMYMSKDERGSEKDETTDDGRSEDVANESDGDNGFVSVPLGA